MHCHECGQNVNTNKTFCSACGAKIKQIAHNEVLIQTKAPAVAKLVLPREVTNFKKVFYFEVAVYVVLLTFVYYEKLLTTPLGEWSNYLILFALITIAIPWWLVYKINEFKLIFLEKLSMSIILISILSLVLIYLKNESSPLLTIIFAYYLISSLYTFVILDNSATIKDWSN